MKKNGTLAITSIQRNRNKYIVEWLAFHLAVGFNQFYIYCHKTDDGMTENLLELSKKYPIQVFSLEQDDLPQIMAYQHAWTNFGAQVDWMAFIDGDEFLFPTQAQSIQEALAAYEHCDLSALGVFWKCYGSNGHLTDPDGLILETHPKHSRNDFLPNRHIKSIVRGGEDINPNKSHLFETKRGTFDENMRPITHGWMRDLAPTYNTLRINHYVVQSKQFYFDKKQSMGGADMIAGFVRPDSYFDEYDRNEDSDGMSLRFLEQTKQKFAEITRTLESHHTSASRMNQTPAHNIVNTDLMRLIPENANRIVEVGCMHGAMARAYRESHPGIHYVGIDIDPDYAHVAAQFCDRTLGVDIEALSVDEFKSLFPSDCWIFGDCLEHLRDPWRIVRMVRESIDPNGCMLVCIPNAQHWSVLMRLATGQFHYEDSGLLDRTHIRWFTRTTMIDMFTQAGWRIENGFSRQIPTQPPQALLEGIRAIAEACGADGQQALADAQAFQYLFRLRPN
ncbi:methyltransferase domain-containing protein [Diaphorobacter sp. JS3050]|uniref:methyltransferase domain-containing protein n=1 Tax=Diaphorobacter sp. JS3050 TaxID=2735554 RepID=UPI0015565E70|nr:methyltransferase domain-containing protein [Diaphorobacter sp. JS3050]QJY34540.1 methyltransferase domain-containing protein [Diaphorobacter sp. JS3050]